MARVLIVEDEPTDQLLLHSILKEVGHEIYMARDGEHAFRK